MMVVEKELVRTYRFCVLEDGCYAGAGTGAHRMCCLALDMGSKLEVYVQDLLNLHIFSLTNTVAPSLSLEIILGVPIGVKNDLQKVS